MGRLLQNQDDIGDAIKPFYGEVAGTELTRLLKDHIAIAADLLVAGRRAATRSLEPSGGPGDRASQLG